MTTQNKAFKIITLCSGLKKNGDKCDYKTKVGDFCKLHAEKLHAEKLNTPEPESDEEEEKNDDSMCDGMCQAKTKKGDACKSKAKSGNFCGRHRSAAEAKLHGDTKEDGWSEWIEEGEGFEEEEGFEYEYTE